MADMALFPKKNMAGFVQLAPQRLVPRTNLVGELRISQDLR